jgi:hypothetical protein
MNAPACKDCLHFRVGPYTYHCIAPQIAKKSVDPITGGTMVTGNYPDRLREDADRCGPDGRWFEPYPYRVPKIEGASPGLKALITCAPLFGFTLLGFLLAATHHPIWLGLLAVPVIPVTMLLLAMLHERDDPP